MNWSALDSWIVIVGALAAVACALPGCYLVLRRMSLMGDAISHAVLPGLAIAFLVTRSMASVPMFIGAAAAGLLTAFLTDVIRRHGRVEAQASLGVVFTTLFALGLILIRRAADHVHLDADCVLYGAIELTPLDTIATTEALAGWPVIGSLLAFGVPRAAAVLGVMVLLNLAFVVAFYKELKISTFDAQLATAQGYSAALMHYVLMALVAMTTVAAFEAVGSILVIAMLIVPPAAAALLTDRLSVMIVLAVVLAAAAAGLGHVMAIVVPGWFGYAETSTAGSMAVAAGLIFTLALLAGPRHGLISRHVTRLGTAFTVSRDDLLALLWRIEQHGASPAGHDFQTLVKRLPGVNPLIRPLLLRSLEREGLATRHADSWRLTDRGRERVRKMD